MEHGDAVKQLLFLGLQDASKVLTRTTMSITDSDSSGKCFRAVVFGQRGSDWAEDGLLGGAWRNSSWKDDRPRGWPRRPTEAAARREQRRPHAAGLSLRCASAVPRDLGKENRGALESDL